jgi:hypothetical protein
MIFLFQFLLIIILFIINIISANKIGKIKKKYNNFMSGSGDVNIEELLEASINKADSNRQSIKEIENHINNIDRNLMQCTQKVGIIRYNAFENLGSDLSFSIALLNSNDCGLILSGIYSRDSSATYAKPIVNGKSKYALSLEEIQALDIAKKTFSENIYTS